ncbi:hypothetical protein T484DRAFT_1761736 [Baffinella frigidus]|nr:hypothetical protein T484DRAFT_1761736 [Cryptophyta sp. CCMP2293]
MTLQAGPLPAFWIDTFLSEAVFGMLVARESSTVRLQTNLLSFANVTLFSSSSLTIAGLIGATDAPGTLPLLGPSAPIFDSVAQWSGGGGAQPGRLELVVAAGQEYTAGSVMELDLAFVNPAVAQEAVTPTVEGTIRFQSGPGIYSDTSNYTIPLTKFPEKILSGAFVCKVAHRRGLARSVNVLSFSLLANVALPAGAVLRFANINAGSNNGSNLVVSGPAVRDGLVSNVSTYLTPGTCAQSG